MNCPSGNCSAISSEWNTHVSFDAGVPLLGADPVINDWKCTWKTHRVFTTALFIKATHRNNLNTNKNRMDMFTPCNTVQRATKNTEEHAASLCHNVDELFRHWCSAKARHKTIYNVRFSLYKVPKLEIKEIKVRREVCFWGSAVRWLGGCRGKTCGCWWQAVLTWMVVTQVPIKASMGYTPKVCMLYYMHVVLYWKRQGEKGCLERSSRQDLR